MRARFRHVWRTATASYWLVPGGMLVASVALAQAALALDLFLHGEEPAWMYVGNAGGAMTVLSTIASSIITVAGVVFSITIAALTQASTQFGPRLLRTFMRDRGNQVVLGTFVATFLYCLLVLRRIHVPSSDEAETFVPRASVTGAVILAAASIGVLIFFIHHVSQSLQAPTLIAAVRRDLMRAIGRLPRRDECAAELRSAGTALEATVRPVAAVGDGYVVAIDYARVVGVAQRADVVVRLCCRPGEYVVKGSTVFLVSAGEHDPAELDRQLTRTLVLAHQATDEQDPEYPIRQLVEIGVRALSPGINDPFTAQGCIDALGSGLCALMRHALPRALHDDERGVLRLIAPVPEFGDVVDTAFDSLRQNAGAHVHVFERLLVILHECAAQATTAEQRVALRRHIDLALRAAERSVREPLDLEVLRERHRTARSAADTTASGGDQEERHGAERNP